MRLDRLQAQRMTISERSPLVVVIHFGVLEALDPEVDARLHVAHGPVGAELLLPVGSRQELQGGIEEVVQQGVSGSRLLPGVVLQPGADLAFGFEGRPWTRKDVHTLAVEEGTNLTLRAADRGGGGDDLGADACADCELFERGFIQPDDGAQEPGNEVQFVLDDEAGGSSPPLGGKAPRPGSMGP